MKFWNAFLFWLVSSTALAEIGEVTEIELSDGSFLRVEEFPPSRSTPWLYFDQAKVSIPAIYPNSELLVMTKNGFSSTKLNFTYSLVSYTENELDEKVRVGGNFRVNESAWRYDAYILKKSYKDIINQIISEIENGNF